MTNTEVAWITGFYEGEGYVTSYKQSHGKTNALYLAIYQNDRKPLQWIKNILGFGHLSVGRVSRPLADEWRFTCHAKNALWLLEKMYPYMKCPKKQRQAWKAVSKYLKYKPDCSFVINRRLK